MNWLSGFKKVTKVVSIGIGAAVTYALTPQGQEIIGGIVKAYPKASVITAGIGLLATLLHSPKA